MELKSSRQLDKGIVEFVKHVTREAQFDFEKVAEATKQFFVWRQVSTVSLDEVTPEFCRRVFSDDYYNEEATPADQRPIEKNPEGVPLKSLEGMSYDELMDYIAKKDQENTRKKEKVFAKVLTSLQLCGEDTSALQHEISAEMTEVMKAYQDRVESAEEEKQRREKITAIAEERKLLAVQRETLRKRFDAGSDDSIGVDPFSEKRKGVKTDKEYGLPDINVDVTDFNIKEVLESKEFNKLLDELETDIYSTNAPPKVDNEFSSPELREIFSFLDSEKTSLSSSSSSSIGTGESFTSGGSGGEFNDSDNSDLLADFELKIKSMPSHHIDMPPMLPPRQGAATEQQSLPTRYPISAPIPVPDPKRTTSASAIIPPNPPPVASVTAGGGAGAEGSNVKADVKSRRHLDFGSKSKQTETIERSYNANGTEIVEDDLSNEDDANNNDDDDDEEEEQNFRSQRSRLMKTALSNIPQSTTAPNPNVWRAFGSTSVDYASLLELQRRQAIKKYEMRESSETFKADSHESESSDSDDNVDNDFDDKLTSSSSSKVVRSRSSDSEDSEEAEGNADEADKSVAEIVSSTAVSNTNNAKSSLNTSNTDTITPQLVPQLSGSFTMRRKPISELPTDSNSTSSSSSSAHLSSPDKSDESASGGGDTKRGSKFGAGLMIPKFGKVRK